MRISDWSSTCALPIYRLRKLGALGQKSVAGMDRFGAGLLRSRENRIDQEIRILRRRRADANGLVGLAHMQRLGIRAAIDRDRPLAETLPAVDATALAHAPGGQDRRQSGGDRGCEAM